MTHAAKGSSFRGRVARTRPGVGGRSGSPARRVFGRRSAGSIARILVAVFLLPAFAASADGVTPDQVTSGSLLLRMQTGYSVATRLNTSIDARISGLVARVSVRQEFLNESADWVEGVYAFPLPDRAAVDHLRMYVGDRFIEGEIREKQKARREYEAAKAEGRQAGLVEQHRANLFTTSVANIAPGAKIMVEIEYLETLRYDEGIFSLRVPTAITPRYVPGAPETSDPAAPSGPGWAANTGAVQDASFITPPFVTQTKDQQLVFTADLNAGVPLDIIASRYHNVVVTDLGGRYHISLADGIVPMDHDLELTWKPSPADSPRAMMFTETVAGQPYVLLMMLPPDELAAELQPRSRELVFVIDTSGSMHGTSLEQATRALTLALGGLTPADTFNVIQFNSTTSALFPDSVPAEAGAVSAAMRYVAGLSADGGTEMLPALTRALEHTPDGTRLKQVIFITDGSVGNEDQLFNLIEGRLGNARLFTVGIGSAPNSLFMRKAAEAGRGTFTTIGALHEVNEKMQRLFRKLEKPQVTDVAVQWPSGNDVVMYPGTVPDLYAGEPVLIRARLASSVRPGDIVRISGQSALGGWAAELSVTAGKDRSGVAALWARSRIEDLMDRKRRGAPEDAVRTGIVETALAHHLVSRYTSLVAIDKTPARASGVPLARGQVPGLLPYGQDQAAIVGFPATATDAPARRLTGLVLIASALLVLLTLVPGICHAHPAKS